MFRVLLELEADDSGIMNQFRGGERVGVNVDVGASVKIRGALGMASAVWTGLGVQVGEMENGVTVEICSVGTFSV
jgi:hypothetical protein